MKAFLILLIITAAAGGGYYLFFANQTEALAVTGKIQISQSNNFDINAPQISGPLYLAVVRGSVTNNSGKYLKNIFIKYKVAGQNTNATIFDLAPGQQVTFNTKGIKTRAANPEYYFDGVQYDEKSL